MHSQLGKYIHEAAVHLTIIFITVHELIMNPSTCTSECCTYSTPECPGQSNLTTQERHKWSLSCTNTSYNNDAETHFDSRTALTISQGMSWQAISIFHVLCYQTANGEEVSARPFAHHIGSCGQCKRKSLDCNHNYKLELDIPGQHIIIKYYFVICSTSLAFCLICLQQNVSR